jgi:hypothetical protein
LATETYRMDKIIGSLCRLGNYGKHTAWRVIGKRLGFRYGWNRRYKPIQCDSRILHSYVSHVGWHFVWSPIVLCAGRFKGMYKEKVK